MLKNFFLQGSGRYLALLPIPLLWITLGLTGQLESLKEQALDLRFRLRGPIPSPVNLVYVDIDSVAIAELKSFPWNHALFEEVCRALVDEGEVKGIGIDIVMSDSGVPQVVDRQAWNAGHAQFGRFLFKDAPVVMAASYASVTYTDEKGQPQDLGFPLLGSAAHERVLPPEMAEWKLRSGVVLNPPLNGLIDTLEGGGMRTVPLFAQLPGRTFYQMGLELARLQLGIERTDMTLLADRIELRRAAGQLALSIPLKKGQLLDINWFSPWIDPQNPRISFVDVLDYARAAASDDDALKAKVAEFFAQFRGAIVLIGPVDRLLQDLSPTPFDKEPVPKVGVHGNVLKTLLSGRFLSQTPLWLEILITLGLTAAVSSLALSAGGRRGLWPRLLAFVIMVLFVLVVQVAFLRFDLIIPLVIPAGAALSTSFFAVVGQLIIEEKQKGRIKGMFGTYVSPALVDRMIASGEEPKLGGVEADITAFFSDIRDFSTFAEKLTPPLLVELMNDYLTVCTNIVQDEGGTLDKYVGDAVVAIYGAPLPLPDHAYRSCVAALNVHKRIAELCQKWARETDKWPDMVRLIQTRIGLSSGPAVVGNMGSSTRFNYTMMGDTVNLGARLESGAKSYGVLTMVSEATRAACEAHGGDRIVFRCLDKIQVKGRNEPVVIHEAVGFKEDLNEATRDCIRWFEEGAVFYGQQRWQEAAALFRRSADVEPGCPGGALNTQLNPSRVFIERCRLMQANPPGENWNGVFVMQTK